MNYVENILYFCDINNAEEFMQSIDDNILSAINKKRKGTLFFASDFESLGASRSVSKALERMTNSGTLLRVARGIYCKPKVDSKWGTGVVLPTFDEIAQAIAHRDKCRIVPTGTQALHLLGLSNQVPMNAVYLTDGSARTIRLSGDRGIRFRHTAPKNLAFTNRLAMLVVFALRELGVEGVTEEMRDHVVALLHKEPEEAVKADLSLMPDWISQIVRRAYEK